MRRLTICWLVFTAGVAYSLQDDQGIVAGRVVNAVTGAPVKDAIVGRVDGSALGKDDKAFANAVVALMRSDGKGSPYSTQADGQGLFHFSAVPPGDYKLLAWDDASRDDLENPAFLKRFDNQAAAVTIGPSGSAAASVKVIEP